MSRQDWQAPLPIDAFSNHFTKALQCGTIPDLKLLIPAISKQSGESYWQQSYRNKGAFDNNSGAWVAQKALDRPAGAVPRRNWEAFADADKTFANWLKRVTPHQDIDFYMTLIDKDETETGHEFESRDKLDMNLDPTSPVISMLAQGFVTKGKRAHYRSIDGFHCNAKDARHEVLHFGHYQKSKFRQGKNRHGKLDGQQSVCFVHDCTIGIFVNRGRFAAD